ncbi:MAG: type I restriction endonuclease [Anaerolineae bacterium]|nr:MAG: type I restriction endonuclease [Anaerolineae bacterium]
MLRQISEEHTRKQLIDPQLERAGWVLRDHSKVKIEVSVGAERPEGSTTFGTIADYCLYRENGEVLAVVEAKKTAVDVKLAEAQLEHYVREIEKHQSFRPFGFLANGREIHFVDVGYAPRREVAGFFTRDDLENLLYLRQNAQPLGSVNINSAIVDRSYQHEAIRRVCEAFDIQNVPKDDVDMLSRSKEAFGTVEPSGRLGNKRRALIVMATGTGKTRTTMALIDVFLRANQARRVLFVADRDELVRQALADGFQKFLPHEPCARLHSWDTQFTQRLYAVTLQTLSNIFEKFSPAFFDLIIFDEVHRSIFNRWSEVMRYFDGRMIGLTATPANSIDRDTFEAFHCYDDKPTYLYTYDQAVKDGYLVDFSLRAARTRFQQEGIKWEGLSEEDRNLLIQNGYDPDSINFEGTELEEKVTVRDTLRKQWVEVMEACYKDPSGMPCKTIVFAMTKKHAVRLRDAFYDLYPQYPGMAAVIVSEANYRDIPVETFKKESLPRIAISVDMLDTGVDIPEVMNLVFMKPVQSPIKLQQMIGRGTRTQAACKFLDWLPEGGKKEFLILDFWENNFDRAAKETADATMPVLVRLFHTRLNLLETYQQNGQDEQDKETPAKHPINPVHPVSTEAQALIADLRAMVGRIPRESLLVRHALPDIEDVWEDGFWNYLLPSSLEKLRLKVAPHLRFAPEVDVPAETFAVKLERLKLLKRKGQKTEDLSLSIAEDVASLPENLLTQKQLSLKRACTVPMLEAASFDELDTLRRELAEMMKKRQKETGILELDFLHDEIALRGYILLTKSGEQMYVSEYREKVEKRILQLVENHPAMQAIVGAERRSASTEIDDALLLDLERTLTRELAHSDLELTPEMLKKVYAHSADNFLALVRQVLEIDSLPDYRELVARQFERYIADHRYNADQIRFLRAVQSVFLQKRRLTPADLYEPPLDRFGVDAVDRWFTEEEVEEVVAFANKLAV